MKHTKGKVNVMKSDIVQGFKIFTVNENMPQLICTVHVEDVDNDEEAEANAEIIKDAFNTTSESGLTPSELLKQNKELLEVLKKANNTLKMASLIDKSTQCEETQKLVQQAINNAKK